MKSQLEPYRVLSRNEMADLDQKVDEGLRRVTSNSTGRDQMKEPQRFEIHDRFRGRAPEPVQDKNLSNGKGRNALFIAEVVMAAIMLLFYLFV